jgi:hypothetical protein
MTHSLPQPRRLNIVNVGDWSATIRSLCRQHVLKATRIGRRWSVLALGVSWLPLANIDPGAPAQPVGSGQSPTFKPLRAALSVSVLPAGLVGAACRGAARTRDDQKPASIDP